VLVSIPFLFLVLSSLVTIWTNVKNDVDCVPNQYVSPLHFKPYKFNVCYDIQDLLKPTY
jgi:hypothetical protein